MKAASPSSVFPDRAAWADTLINLLQQQCQLVDQIAVLAQHQRKIIEAGQNQSLLELLTRRQDLIDQLNQGQTELAPLTESLERYLAQLDSGKRDLIRERLNHLQKNLSEIMERDEQDQLALQQQREEMKQEMHTIDTTQRARKAYLNQSTPTNRFTDHQG